MKLKTTLYSLLFLAAVYAFGFFTMSNTKTNSHKIGNKKICCEKNECTEKNCPKKEEHLGTENIFYNPLNRLITVNYFKVY